MSALEQSDSVLYILLKIFLYSLSQETEYTSLLYSWNLLFIHPKCSSFIYQLEIPSTSLSLLSLPPPWQ